MKIIIYISADKKAKLEENQFTSMQKCLAPLQLKPSPLMFRCRELYLQYYMIISIAI